FPQQRFRLFDAATQALVACARAEPLAIMLDDLHAADLPSLHLLLFVARQIADAPVVLVGTARDSEARAAPAVHELLVTIARAVRALALPRLSREDVARWVEGSAEADSVFEVTEGNPLFVQE